MGATILDAAKLLVVEDRFRAADLSVALAKAELDNALRGQSSSSVADLRLALDLCLDIQRKAQIEWNRVLSVNGPSDKFRKNAMRTLDESKARSVRASLSLKEAIAAEERCRLAKLALEAAVAARGSLPQPEAREVLARIASAADESAKKGVLSAEVNVKAATSALKDAVDWVPICSARVSEANRRLPVLKTRKKAARKLRQCMRVLEEAKAAVVTAEALLLSAAGELVTARERLRSAGQDAIDAVSASSPSADPQLVVALVDELIVALTSPKVASGSMADSRQSSAKRNALSALRGLRDRLEATEPKASSATPLGWAGKSTCRQHNFF